MVGSTPAAQAAALYEQDFAERTRQQVSALRSAQHGGFEAIELDYEHLAKEIERLGENRERAGPSGLGAPI